ncbi:MAG: lipoyl synthase [Spirochaetales bacterium]|nr:lipoyl synthase [Spirochaetales bacterium]
MPELKKPHWLKSRGRFTPDTMGLPALFKKRRIKTVCEAAACPNRLECYGNKTATFLICGSVCTRHCTFCNIGFETPGPLDPDEPSRIAETVADLHLKYTVITSVTRDDLEDGGAGHFAETVKAIRRLNPDTKIEVLIPDFQGKTGPLDTICKATPFLIAHNVETVPRLYTRVRPEADYRRSLVLLERVKERDPAVMTKSGIMLGLGETTEEVQRVFSDLRDSHCDCLTIGQYLPPSKDHFPVKEYITPGMFNFYREQALETGFSRVASAPLVRSSYNAGEFFGRES